MNASASTLNGIAGISGSELRGCVAVPVGLPLWRRIVRFAGPGLLVSVGYMDPGNWATDVEAGSRYGNQLLLVVLLSSLAAIVLQCLSMRLGIATGKDLARHCRERYGAVASWVLWPLAELSIVACDLAEVLGGALAFKLLLGVPLWLGVVLTAFDLLLVLGLRGRGFRQIEALVLALVLVIGGCFAVELLLIEPVWHQVAIGLVPRAETWSHAQPWYLAVGIVGATVMPHNLYLHSAIVRTRAVRPDLASRRDAVAMSRVDTIVSLVIAAAINSAMLILAASAFHAHGQPAADIQDAHRLLEPIVGTALAGTLFAVALLASGQSSTLTGTIAAQVVMDGFLDLRMPMWKRRAVTRVLALVPALIGVLALGDRAIGALLVLSQVVLSLQLPFAIFPLIRLTSDARVMGALRSGPLTAACAWGLCAIISAANIWLIAGLV